MEAVADAARHGLDEGQLETVMAVISLFNYYTRVADASGIEFDYQTPLPAFQPDLSQAAAIRPQRKDASGRAADQGRRRLKYPPLQAAWETWRSYVMHSDEPISARERHLLAAVAAEESSDWAGAAALGGASSAADGDDQLIEFARKLSRQPWTMQAADLAALRAAGYSERALLHIISVVAHQNADSRLAIGLSALG